MANISLREYIKKIENQIDNGQIDQAIAHCKHILQSFPKHIDSYRLLGKAFLEKQKYGDASDILQRVLSSVPDDFISHIGMSIIREDENNLDAAIWHMERAFEVQPSNKAVQDELRRLYTSRDGVAPPKIRLTRGALVRMYTRGELYNQAIAEIWAALEEDPNRVDLEVVLARIYFLLGQKVEATETCSKLISKLPYCYEANRVLTEILPGTTREEDVKIFRQRVIDLDPYFQFVDENSVSPSEVSDSRIMIDYLEWVPGMSVDDQPDWAQSIGFNLEKDDDSTEDISTWLSEISTQSKESITPDFIQGKSPDNSNLEEIFGSDSQHSPEDTISNTHELIDENEQKLPGWIKEAGWELSSEGNETLEKGFTIASFGEENPEGSEFISKPTIEEPSENILESLQPADIPDWLQEIAPKEPSLHLPDEEDETEIKNLEDLFSTFDEKQPEKLISESELNWEREFSEETKSSIDRPTEQGGYLPDATEKMEVIHDQEVDREQVDFLDWIKDIPGVEEINKIEPETDLGKYSPHLSEEKLVDHTRQNPSEELIPSQNEIDIPDDDDWLNSLILDDKEKDTKSQIVMNEKEDIPDWIKSVIEEEKQEEVFDSENTFPDWLKLDVEPNENPEDDIKISFNDEIDQAIPLETSFPIEFVDENGSKEIIQEGETVNMEFNEILENELFIDLEKTNEKTINEIDTSSVLDENELTTKEIQEGDIEKIISELQFNEEIIEHDSLMDHDIELDSNFVSESNEFLTTAIEEKIRDEEVDDDYSKLLENIKPLDEIDIGEEPISIDDTLDEYEMFNKDDQSNQTKHEQGLEDMEPPVDLESFLSELETKSDDLIKKEEDLPLTEKSDEEEELKSALAWMEGLAIKQGAEEETLVSKPEERSDTPPVWVSAEVQNFKDDEDEEDQSLTPSWLKELEIETGETLSLDKSFSQEVVEKSDELIPLDYEKVEENNKISQEIDQEGLLEGQNIEIQPGLNDKLNEIEPNQEYVLKVEEISAIESIDEVEDLHLFEEIKEKTDQMPFDDAFEQPILEDIIVEDVSEITHHEEESAVIVAGISETLNDFEPIKSFEEEIEDTKPIKIKNYQIEELSKAKNFLDTGNIEEAILRFTSLIHDGFELDEIILTIQSALDHHYPIDINLWQLLGDAFLKNNQLQNALDAYSKAEDLLL